MTSCAEIWRDIPGYEGKYQASNLGRVRSVGHYVQRWVKGRVLRPRIRERGYPVVTLSGAGPKDVHQLVALAFLGPKEKGQQVRHLNGDKLDARAENLAYGTQSENERDKFRYAEKRNKLTIYDAREIRFRVNVLEESVSYVASDYGVTEATIRQVAKGVTFSWLE